MSTPTRRDVVDAGVRRRAIEAAIWSMPAVNFEVMHQAMVRDAKAGEGSNKIVYWSQLFGWKTQTLAPNPDPIYFMPFFHMKDTGLIVLEVPPAQMGASRFSSVSTGRRSPCSTRPGSCRISRR